ncbi:MAG: hypothetical protein IJ371_05425 [Clostridia bacterium]|nr:hypothetical protein [Clostridia bacterium]
MIYRKSDRQIEKEKSEQRYYARLVNGTSSPVCEYFVVHQTKGNIDVWNLTTEEIVEYIISNKHNNGFDILKYCKQEQMINNYRTLQTIKQMERQHGHIVRDIIGSMGGYKLYNEAYVIVDYKSKIEGQEVEVDEVIESLAINQTKFKDVKVESQPTQPKKTIITNTTELEQHKSLIYRKSDAQIQKEKGEQLYYARLVKGIPSPVCEHFVVHKTRGIVDIWNISTQDIVNFILSNKNNNGFDILKYCNQDQMINDYSTLQSILDMEQQHGHIIRDIIGSMGGFKLYNNAKTIALYQSQVEGREVTVQDIISDYVNYENAQYLQQEQTNKEDYGLQTGRIEGTQQVLDSALSAEDEVDREFEKFREEMAIKNEKQRQEIEKALEEDSKRRDKIKSRDSKADFMDMITCSAMSHIIDFIDNQKPYVDGAASQIDEISEATKDAIKRSFKLMCSHDDRRIKVDGEFQSVSDVVRRIFTKNDTELLETLLKNEKISNDAKQILEDLQITMPMGQYYHTLRNQVDYDFGRNTYWGQTLKQQWQSLEKWRELGSDNYWTDLEQTIGMGCGATDGLAKEKYLNLSKEDKKLENEMILWGLHFAELKNQEMHEEDKFKF